MKFRTDDVYMNIYCFSNDWFICQRDEKNVYKSCITAQDFFLYFHSAQHVFANK